MSSPYYNKYQQGGSLVYNPFIPKSITGKSQTNKDFSSDLEYDETPFPVEPVRVEGIQDWTGFYQPSVEPTVTRGTTQFKHENIDVGNMRELLDKFEEAGISVRVTSGMENRKTKSGKSSKHTGGLAIDITPIPGQTYAELTDQLKNAPEVLAYMRENGIGIIDETDPLTKLRTGATGDHWHISRGGERLALLGFNKLFGQVT